MSRLHAGNSAGERSGVQKAEKPGVAAAAERVHVACRMMALGVTCCFSNTPGDGDRDGDGSEGSNVRAHNTICVPPLKPRLRQ